MQEDFNTKLNLLIKSEKALLRLEMRKRGRQSLFIAVALLAVLAALALLNVAIYLYLLTKFSPVSSAGILSGFNLMIAVIFFIVASRQDAGPESEPLEDIRDFALEQVSRDLDGVKQQVGEFTEGIRKVSGSLQSVMSRDYAAPTAMLPFIHSLLAARKKKRQEASAEE